MAPHGARLYQDVASAVSLLSYYCGCGSLGFSFFIGNGQCVYSGMPMLTNAGDADNKKNEEPQQSL